MVKTTEVILTNSEAQRFASILRATYGVNLNIKVDGTLVTIEDNIYETQSTLLKNNKTWSDFKFVRDIEEPIISLKKIELSITSSDNFGEQSINYAQNATSDLLDYYFQQNQYEKINAAVGTNNKFITVTLPDLALVDNLLLLWGIDTYGKPKIATKTIFDVSGRT